MRAPLIIVTTGLLLCAGALAALWFSLPDPSAFASRNPKTTAVIEQRRAEAKRARRPFGPRQHWVGLDRVSPHLIHAVLASEDASFYAHGGFDWDEMNAAAREGLRKGKKMRGASTITQQVAKNLWLGTERSLWRKGREAILAAKMERSLSKRRILTLYLNIAEWGDGVFGAEAASQRWFSVSAADLSTAQATLLASMLPAPRRANLHDPPRWLAKRSRRLIDRLLAAGRIDADEHAHASADLERYLAGASGDEDPPDEEEDT